jgi:two-component system OmpR family sensor kinase
MNTSLRGRFAIAFALAFVVTLAVLFSTLHVALRSVLIADLDDELNSYAQALLAASAQDGSAPSAQQLTAMLAAGQPERLRNTPLVALVLNGDGQVVGSSRGTPPPSPQLRAGELDRLRMGESWERNVKSSRGRTLRVSLRPVFADGNLVAVLETAATLNLVDAATDRLQTLLLGEGIIAIIVATAAGYLVARGGLRPLDGVARLAADIEAHDLTRRLHLRNAPLEIRRLADTFDAMLDRLEQAFALQRTFALDVAHELRTPLTALRGNFDVLLLDPNLDAEMRAQIEPLAAETGRMMRLTSNLLALAQAEAGRRPEQRPVDIDVLCLEVYQQARALRPAVSLRLGNEDQVTLDGDRDLLKQLILNLVENGLKYTPDGGTVTLSLERDRDAARIIVEDTGPGIRPEDLPHIFERFYRAAPTGGRISGGAGIGLAVAHWIATAHGGTIAVSNRDGGGSIFTVRLPLAQTAATGDAAAGEAVGPVAPVALPQQPFMTPSGHSR